MKSREINEVIAEAREEAGLSLESLSRLIELRGHALSGAAIWRIEQGKYLPNYKTLLALSTGLKGRFIINEDGAKFRFGKGRD